jgi:hypothetical protein
LVIPSVANIDFCITTRFILGGLGLDLRMARDADERSEDGNGYLGGKSDDMSFTE